MSELITYQENGNGFRQHLLATASSSLLLASESASFNRGGVGSAIVQLYGSNSADS